MDLCVNIPSLCLLYRWPRSHRSNQFVVRGDDWHLGAQLGRFVAQMPEHLPTKQDVLGTTKPLLPVRHGRLVQSIVTAHPQKVTAARRVQAVPLRLLCLRELLQRQLLNKRKEFTKHSKVERLYDDCKFILFVYNDPQGM